MIHKSQVSLAKPAKAALNLNSIFQRSIDEIMGNLGDDMVFTEDLETLMLRTIAAAEGKLEEFDKRVAIKGDWRSDTYRMFFFCPKRERVKRVSEFMN